MYWFWWWSELGRWLLWQFGLIEQLYFCGGGEAISSIMAKFEMWNNIHLQCKCERFLLFDMNYLADLGQIFYLVLHPRIFLNYFALELSESKTKQLRNVLGRKN